ncbi:hypothetical protein AWM79_18290 [Pseudomonas agarici]|uniref:Uncharacterized protein n=1 Tax=Pseudomonas agarici TaxID=46677 RepID=A0A0X1T4W1_PSEAA|nr:hypothetical protein [Pseudomonas agarici]AMB87144.1 hypothetical protein AWM79_18290 [Pseudomonas agarici]
MKIQPPHRSTPHGAETTVKPIDTILADEDAVEDRQKLKSPARITRLDNREWRTLIRSGKFARLQPQGRQVSVMLKFCAMD